MRMHDWRVSIEGLADPSTTIVTVVITCRICGKVRRRELDTSKITGDDASRLADEDHAQDIREGCAGVMN